MTRCTHYTERTRCEATATVRLLHPDGSPNPGGYVCGAHGETIVAEYRTKLGELWTTMPLNAEA